MRCSSSACFPPCMASLPENINKVLGGNKEAEMFWRGERLGVHLEIASKQHYLEVKQLKTNKQLSIKDTEINSRESVEVIEVGLFPHQQIWSMMKAFIWLNEIQDREIKPAQLTEGRQQILFWLRPYCLIATCRYTKIKMIKQRSVMCWLTQVCKWKPVPFWARWLYPFQMLLAPRFPGHLTWCLHLPFQPSHHFLFISCTWA